MEKSLATKKPSSLRAIGIDFGLKRIGLAVSDSKKIIASPLSTIAGYKNVEKSAESVILCLQNLEKQHGWQIDEIVVGLPLFLNGQESERSVQVRQFAKVLEEKLLIPIHLFDERLTSVQADRSLKESNFSRKKRAQFVDAVSAVILLQTYLDKQSFQKRMPDDATF